MTENCGEKNKKIIFIHILFNILTDRYLYQRLIHLFADKITVI